MNKKFYFVSLYIIIRNYEACYCKSIWYGGRRSSRTEAELDTTDVEEVLSGEDGESVGYRRRATDAHTGLEALRFLELRGFIFFLKIIYLFKTN